MLFNIIHRILSARAAWVIAAVSISVYVVVWLMPECAMSLAFCKDSVLLEPWRLITYTFVHLTPLHLAINVAVVLALGCMLKNKLSDIQFVAIYCVGGIAGALLYMASPVAGPLVGASAGVFALAAAAVSMSRGFASLISIIALAIVCLVTAGGHNVGGVYAHLGGILAGTLVVVAFKFRSRRRGDDIVKQVEQSGYASLSDSQRETLFRSSGRK